MCTEEDKCIDIHSEVRGWELSWGRGLGRDVFAQPSQMFRSSPDRPIKTSFLVELTKPGCIQFSESFLEA